MANDLTKSVVSYPLGLPLTLRLADGQMWATTLDPSNPVQEAILIKALSRPDYGAEDCPREPFEVADLVLHRSEIEDRNTGELVPVEVLTLVGPAGKTYGFTSYGIRQHVLAICRVRGMPPWEPPLRVVTSVMRQPNGNQWRRLDIA